jgi:hypothetical protein
MTTRTSVAAGLALVAAAWPAWAVLEGEPYLSLRHGHTDNLFEAPRDSAASADRPRVSDDRETVTVGAVLQYTWGLQRATANLEAARVLHREFDALDHTTYEVGTGLDWQIARLWEGQLTVERRRELERFADRDTIALGLLDRSRVDASVRWKPTPRLALEPSLGLRRLAYERPSSRGADRDELIAGIEGLYTGNPVALVGVGVEVTSGRYPGREGQPQRFGTLGDGFQQTDAFTRMEYRFSGISSVQAELGYSWRDAEGLSAGVPDRDLSGATGRLRYRRQQSALTLIQLELFRRLDSVEEFDAVSAERWGALAELDYALTRRIRLEGRYRYERLDYVGGGAAATPAARADRIDVYRAALRYQPLLWLGITGGVESEQRRSNRDARSFETGIGFIEIEARYD